MGLQGFEGCDIPCEPGFFFFFFFFFWEGKSEPGWQLQAADADCAEEDGGPIRQCTGGSADTAGQKVVCKAWSCC